MDIPFGDMGKDRKIAVMIEEEVELDRSLGLSEGCPVEKGGAELDNGGIKAEKLVFEAELLFPRGNGLTLSQQLVEYLLVELPGSFFIGI